MYRTAFTRGSADGNPLFNPFDLNLKNCSNTGVLFWGNRLLSLYEVGGPAPGQLGVTMRGGVRRRGGLLVGRAWNGSSLAGH